MAADHDCHVPMRSGHVGKKNGCRSRLPRTNAVRALFRTSGSVFFTAGRMTAGTRPERAITLALPPALILIGVDLSRHLTIVKHVCHVSGSSFGFDGTNVCLTNKSRSFVIRCDTFEYRIQKFTPGVAYIGITRTSPKTNSTFLQSSATHTVSQQSD